MKVTVLYVGSSLLRPLRNAEREVSRAYQFDINVMTYNFAAPFTELQWSEIEHAVAQSDVVFVIHVIDGENAARLVPLLDRHRRDRTIIVINCMPDLMRRTRMGKLDLGRLPGSSRKRAQAEGSDNYDTEEHPSSLIRAVTSWIGRQAKNGKANGHGRADYLKWVDRLPSLLRFVPNAGPLGDAKNYLLIVSYFLQPTPRNIQSMILCALKYYGADDWLKVIEIPPPETLPSVAIYHPDAPRLFESVEDYQTWHEQRETKTQNQSPKTNRMALDPKSTVGLLLMRPQIVSNSRKHYDGLIRAIEAEGLSVVPAIATLMDNREACEKFFLDDGPSTIDDEDFVHRPSSIVRRPRVSQIVSLTGFSFVGGPAMNDSEAAAQFLRDLNIPFRSMFSLDAQTIDSWRESPAGLNPVQMGMQVAIPEIDGAT